MRMRLAFDETAGEWKRGSQRLRIPVDQAELAELVGHLGQIVLLFSGAASAQTAYVATGQFCGLVQDGERFTALVDGRRDFENVRLNRPGFSVIRDNWRGIHDRDFDNLTEQPGGLSECAQASFHPTSDPVQFPQCLLAFQSSVLDHYGQSCAVTDHNHNRRLVAAPIRPVGQGGQMITRNCLVMAEDAAAAFAQFHFTLGADDELIVDCSRIDPELTERLYANGYARLPSDAAARPSTESLGWHRQRFRDLTGID